MPQISVIVPVYNVEKYIHRCVDSILAQTFTDFELILVDDGSPDNCGAVCDEYAAKDSRVVVIHQENGGLSAARNAGIDWAFANSNSQWLTFIDSDDWVHKDYLYYLYEAAVSNSVALSMCMCVETFEYTNENDAIYIVHILAPTDAYILKNRGVTAFACGRLYAKNCFQQLRYPLGKVFEDLFVTYKILFSQRRIAFVSGTLYYYYQNPESITKRKWTLQRMDELEAYEEQLVYFYKSGNIDTFEHILSDYLKALCNHISKIKESDYSNAEKKRYHHVVQNKLRKSLMWCHKKSNIQLAQLLWVVECAYPVEMKFFWIYIAVKNKIKAAITRFSNKH